jgi:cysteinyl-tRNA synthetase
MITIGGQKMGKSLGNFITLPELFSGRHPLLAHAYDPMTIRFFILQAHYRGTLDFSNEALDASEKGYRKVMQGYRDLAALAAAAGCVSPVKGSDGNPAGSLDYGEMITDIAPDAAPEGTSPEVKAVFDGVYEALCDDINTPVALAKLFEGVRLVNLAKDGSSPLSKLDLEVLERLFEDVLFGVLGLRDTTAAGPSDKSEKTIAGLMEMVLEDRAAAKAAKDWPRSDAIRDHLKALGIVVKDTKNGPEWTIE